MYRLKETADPAMNLAMLQNPVYSDATFHKSKRETSLWLHRQSVPAVILQEGGEWSVWEA